VKPYFDDWDLLMTSVDSCLDCEENVLFDSLVHLVLMNDLINLHNRKMFKSLNFPIARCVSKCARRLDIVGSNDDVLDCEVLLCRGQHVMLMCNLWVEVGLVNEPPQLLQFATVIFEKYIVVPFDKNCPNGVPIAPFVRGNLRQIPLKMAWGLTIHKS